VASGFVRQISSPFTTRLALVLASWADENIFVSKPYKTHFVASFQKVFFLLVDFERTSQEALEGLEATRSTFKYVSGIHGSRSIADPSRDFPLYV
jgi:hypothetical protein